MKHFHKPNNEKQNSKIFYSKCESGHDHEEHKPPETLQTELRCITPLCHFLYKNKADNFPLTCQSHRGVQIKTNLFYWCKWKWPINSVSTFQRRHSFVCSLCWSHDVGAFVLQFVCVSSRRRSVQSIIRVQSCVCVQNCCVFYQTLCKLLVPADVSDSSGFLSCLQVCVWTLRTGGLLLVSWW